MSETVRTKFLILSDTHGFTPETAVAGPTKSLNLSNPRPHALPCIFRPPLPSEGVDVVIHCGDLTKRSNPIEYEATFRMLRAHPAPLKLAIPGNHDMTLDENMWGSRTRSPYADDLTRVQDIIADARQDNVHCLVEEAERTFDLPNGARLRVWTSPWTPSYGSWGFQYEEARADGTGGHHFAIPRGIDVVITHGPPAGVLDLARFDTRAGDPSLWRALVDARPRLHCFGHIHEAWGARGVRWLTHDDNDANDEYDSNDKVVDESKDKCGWSLDSCPVVDRTRSGLVMDKNFMRPCLHGDIVENARRLENCKKLVEDGCAKLSLCDGPWDERAADEGGQTMFINASVLDERYVPTYAPWLVEMDLEKTVE